MASIPHVRREYDPLESTKDLLPFFEKSIANFLESSAFPGGSRFQVVRTISSHRHSGYLSPLDTFRSNQQNYGSAVDTDQPLEPNFISRSSSTETESEYGHPYSRECDQILLRSHAPLLILDSSFNPPNGAHAALINAGIEWEMIDMIDDHSEDSDNPGFIPTIDVLLLFSTTNADKEASIPEYLNRLAMMHLFALDLVTTLRDHPIKIHLGLTCEPYYVGKAEVISKHLRTANGSNSPHPQAYAVGYDTLIRFLDPKYYLDHDRDAPLSALASFFDQDCLLLAMDRPDNKAESSIKDDALCLAAYLDSLKNGLLASQGFRSSWESKILALPLDEDTQNVSSTSARCVSRQLFNDEASPLDWEASLVASKLCCGLVSTWIQEYGVYR